MAQIRPWMQALIADHVAAEDYKDYLEGRMNVARDKADEAAGKCDMDLFRRCGGELAAYKALKAFFVNSQRELIDRANRITERKS